MDHEMNENESSEQQMAGETSPDSSAAESVLERGAEAYGQAEKAVGDVYEKTAQAVGETYEQVKTYSSKNPGKSLLIALGIGAGVGFILGASTRRSRTGRLAKPVVHALSDIALEFLR